MIIPLYIIDTGGSAATVGLFSFLSLIPIILIYPFAGVAGDRLNRKSIMVGTDLANGLIILGLAFAAYSGRMGLALLFAVQVLTSILYGFFDPATKGMLPQVVPKEELTKANSTVASLRIFSSLLSPVIGAAVYASQGIAVLFLINGISFLLSAGSEMLIRYKHIKRDVVVGVSGLSRDLSEGVKFVLDNKVIGKLCVFFPDAIGFNSTDIFCCVASVFQNPSGIFRPSIRLPSGSHCIWSTAGQYFSGYAV